jgi:hypothetical protein
MEQAIERRKHKRFNLLTDTVAFVRTSLPACTTAGRITNISMEGLQFFHLCGKLSSDVPLELDVTVAGEIDLLEHLSGKIVFDCQSETENIGVFSARQCGVHFEDLTEEKKSYVRHLIDNHTTDN